MGLAASQARLLLLTARKNDVESQMMSISNDKLSLSRQASALSEDYSNALNAQKLVWSTTTDTTDLSYGLLTSPALLDGQYAVLNSSSGAVVINSALAASLGLSGESGSAADIRNMSINDFVCTAMGISSTQDADRDNRLDRDEIITGITSIQDADTSADISSTQFQTAYSDGDVFEELFSNYSYAAYSPTSYNGGQSVKYDQVGTFDAHGDNQPVCITAFGSGATNTAIANSVVGFVTGICGSASGAVLSVLESQFSYSDEAMQLLEAAADAATIDTAEYYQNQAKSTYRVTNANNGDLSQATIIASGTTAIADAAWGNSDYTNNDEIYMDVSQIVKTFLAYFDAECAMINGIDDNGDGAIDEKATAGKQGDNANYLNQISQTSSKTWIYSSYTDYITTDHYPSLINGSYQSVTPHQVDLYTTHTTYSAVTRSKSGTGTTCSEIASVDAIVKNDGSNDLNNNGIGNGIGDTYEEKYYMNLYYLMATYGWELNNSVSDSTYFQDQVMNGNMAVMKMDDYGDWNMLSINGANSPLATEADDSKTQEAEAEYEAKKDQLDYKESQLDLKMNDLDTERSAIETEVDSVQKLITKNIESSFKLFQNA